MARRIDEPLPRLAPRAMDSHKGTYGRALIVGGSRGMAGAAALAGMAALRGGAGLVHVAVPEMIVDLVAGFEPSYLTAALPADDQGRFARSALAPLVELAIAASAVALGPGLGQSAELRELVVELYRTIDRPVLVDADGLNLLAESPDALRSVAVAPRILTPHPGEFSRLLGGRTFKDVDERRAAADELAVRSGAVVLLKGHRTYITDGQRAAENPTGNPGMATGGTGDVLSGLIVALICQGMTAFDAARAGAYLHGLAGDLAAAELGQISLIASDLILFLPQAMQNGS